MPREKSRYRDRRSVSYSSDSSYEKKKTKSKHRRRTRSRDRSESTHKRRRSSSRSRHTRRSYTRSLSRERHESKTSSKRSLSRPSNKRSKRSPSRNRSHSRSNSRSRSKHSKKSRRKSYSSSSRSSSVELIKPQAPRLNFDDSETKVEKAIKAAEAAGLTMTRLPTYEFKDVDIKEDMPTIHDRDLLAELNSDTFVQKTFTSSRNKKKQSIVIDLNAETVTVPETDMKVEEEDSIINFDALPSEEEIKEMWIQKLHQYRKKILKEEI